MTAADDRSKEQDAALVLQRRLAVMDQYMRGSNQYTLAAKHGVTQQTISKDLAWVRKLWVKNTMLDMDEAKAREVAKLDNLELMYLEEWQRSKQTFSKTRHIKTAKSRPSRRKTKEGELLEQETEKYAEDFEETEERAGDPRYLQGAERCVEQRCKILGLYAATKVEATGKDGKDLIPPASDQGLKLTYYEMPPDEASLVAAILKEAGAVAHFEQPASGN
jgi:hypothetical protein